MRIWKSTMTGASLGWASRIRTSSLTGGSLRAQALEQAGRDSGVDRGLAEPLAQGLHHDRDLAPEALADLAAAHVLLDAVHLVGVEPAVQVLGQVRQHLAAV